MNTINLFTYELPFLIFVLLYNTILYCKTNKYNLVNTELNLQFHIIGHFAYEKY